MPTEVAWKKDVTEVSEKSLKDCEVLKDKVLKLVDAFDDPEDFEEGIAKIAGKTDLGVAFMEILREYVSQQLEDEEDEEAEPEPEEEE
jgi:hypothetical protein